MLFEKEMEERSENSCESSRTRTAIGLIGAKFHERNCTRRATQVSCVVTTRFSRSRSEEHTSELQSRLHLVCRLLLEKKKSKYTPASFKGQCCLLQTSRLHLLPKRHHHS